MLSLVVSLPRILLRDSNGVKIKIVPVALGEPKDRLVASAEAPSMVKPVAVGPYDPVRSRISG